MRITVDETLCCSSGQCVLTAPDVFDQREEDGISFPLQPQPGADQRAAVEDAAALCPTRAITVHE
jgi:ferredoxin